jgi:phospholipase/carboxylesterase
VENRKVTRNILKSLVRGPADPRDGDPVLVLLHGRGSDMRDLQGLARVLPPRGTLVTPQAPHHGLPWGYGPGWAWYRYLGQNRAEIPSLVQSLEALEEFLKNLPERIGFQPGPLVLGGFSQGGTTSLAYTMVHPASVDAVVVLSGFLVRTEGLGQGEPDPAPEKLGSTPVFWAHGTQDPAVPFQLALSGWEKLRAAGIDTETRSYPMGHWVSPDELVELKEWLERTVPGWS